MTNIVMLVRNRHRLVEQALGTLIQNTPADQYTLTIIDDASDDFRTRKLLENVASYSVRTSVLRVERSPHVIGRLKNIGVAWSNQIFGKGDWLYLSDCDTAFTENWLEKLTFAAMAGEIHGFKLFGGQVHPFHQPDPNLFITIGERFAGTVLKEHLVLDGPSWLLRWSTWREVGQFSRACAPGPCQSEDAEWCARLVARGGRIGVIHPHVVAHVGLTQTDGADAPGRKEREAQMIPGILYE